MTYFCYLPLLISLLAATSVGGNAANAETLFLSPGALNKQPLPERLTQSPEWFRKCPALYVPSCVSAGGAYLMFSDYDRPGLHRRIDSFLELPELLEQARRLGTDTLYLIDYYEGRPGQDPESYWRHKGDYMPRRDLGGEEAFAKGIAQVHQRGGRVVLYVEAFIAHEDSQVGGAHGAKWSIATADGPPEEPYSGNWKLCPGSGWAEHVAATVRRLVSEYGADGIFLDSYGYQKNWQCVSRDHAHEPAAPEAFNAGCAKLVESVREAVQAENPEAVVLIEGPELLELFRFADASLDWGIHTLSRERAGAPPTVFTAGWSLDDMHQILACGQKLALSDWWLQPPAGGSCELRLESLPTSELPPGREPDAIWRRYQAERHFQILHRWRNAGLLQSVSMPTVDDVTPRRWDQQTTFGSGQATSALLAEVRRRAAATDRALKSAAKPLRSPADHLRRLLEARRRLSPILDEATSIKLITASESVAAFRISAPAGMVVSVVNVSNEEQTMRLPASLVDRLTDTVSGEKLTCGERALVSPAHSLRLWHAEVPSGTDLP